MSYESFEEQKGVGFDQIFASYGVFHWGHLVSNYGFFEGWTQCLQSLLGSVVISRRVTVDWQNVKHVATTLTLDPDFGSTNLVTVLSCVYSLLDAFPFCPIL